MDVAAQLRKAYVDALTGTVDVYDSIAPQGSQTPYAVVTDVDYEPILNKSANFVRANVTLELYGEAAKGGGMSDLDDLASTIIAIAAPLNYDDLFAITNCTHVGAKVLSINNDRQVSDTVNIFRKICRITHYVTY